MTCPSHPTALVTTATASFVTSPQKERDSKIMQIGNIVHESVPHVMSEDHNRVERTWGQPTMKKENKYVALRCALFSNFHAQKFVSRAPFYAFSPQKTCAFHSLPSSCIDRRASAAAQAPPHFA